MSEKEQQVDMTPGTISWNELMTTDLEASRQFIVTDPRERPWGSGNLQTRGDAPQVVCGKKRHDGPWRRELTARRFSINPKV